MNANANTTPLPSFRRSGSCFSVMTQWKQRKADDARTCVSGINKDPMNPAKVEYTAPLALPTRGLNFLLVDDDDICLFIHRRVLELTGYCSSAHSASNGKTALDILRRADAGAMPLPDIILLDLEMPLMNGLAFLDAFRGLPC